MSTAKSMYVTHSHVAAGQSEVQLTLSHTSLIQVCKEISNEHGAG